MVPRGFMLQYTLEDVVLGTGNFSIVKKGFRNHDYHDKVAVKIISKCEDLGTDNKYEFEIVKHLSHRNVLKIYDFFENETKCYIIMEYSAAGDLCQYIRKHGALSDNTAQIPMELL